MAAVITSGLLLAGLARPALGQASYPKDEIFGGYSVLFPNGWEELNYKADNIPNAFDVSNTYYFCKVCNLGFVLDGSGHYKGGTTPPNLENGSNDSTGVGYALAGLQYKWHTETISPFIRALMGAANISPDCCHGTMWRFAVGGGVVWTGTFPGGMRGGWYRLTTFIRAIHTFIQAAIRPSGTACGWQPDC
ncbi:MAG TPA: hypothetical protein VMT53_21480 [Terriglobales bacterium]|nr:hypothetical protein [Terriglobales bacterium]